MAPFAFSPIARTCLALNGKLRITHGDDRDPRPLVRLYIPQTRVSVFLTETHLDLPDAAYGLVDEDDGFPRCKLVNLATLAERGAEIDPTFQGVYPLSHYAGVAEIAGSTILDNRRIGTR